MSMTEKVTKFSRRDLLTAKEVLSVYREDAEALDIINRTHNSTEASNTVGGEKKAREWFGPTPRQSQLNIDVLLQDIDARLGLISIRVDEPDKPRRA